MSYWKNLTRHGDAGSVIGLAADIINLRLSPWRRLTVAENEKSLASMTTPG